MYAGFFTSRRTASWLGAHQKFNRRAYAMVRGIYTDSPERIKGRAMLAHFPRLKLIQHFEGINGPDGIKVKSPGQNEPWHFYDPFDEMDEKIFTVIEEHFTFLVKAITENEEEKAAFEASWLAHTLTDGLTPAHHYPYEEELHKLRGEGRESRDSKTKKVIIKGDSFIDTVRRNWHLHGGRGLLSTHIAFEAGVTGAVLTHPIRGSMPSDIELEYAQKHGLIEVFKRYAEEIGRMNLYGRYYERGWTSRVARDVRYRMAPLIVRTIAIAWLLALEEASKP